MGVIKFNGVGSDTLNIVVETRPDYEMPLKKYERVHIPGRNGDIVIDTGDYDNVNRTYNVAIVGGGLNAPALSRKLSKWLNQPGYCRLEDTYQPDVYMLATYEEQISIVNMFDQAGRASITFNRMPQRFLKSGETPIEFHEDNSCIRNPTDRIALPQIKIYGSGAGSVTIGDHIINISHMGGYIIVDSVKQDVYTDIRNMNGYVTLTNGFPELITDETIPIKFSGDVTRVDITPNWWVI